MKTYIIYLLTRLGAVSREAWVLSALIAVINLIPTGSVTAQTFTTLYSFTASSTNSSGVYTNTDGANPYAGLIVSGTTLYGTAVSGGSSGGGAVFALNTDGTGFTNLHSFTALSFGINGHGASPYAGLLLSGNTLYGTAAYDGGSLNSSSVNGTVFALNTDGTGFTNLHSFTTPSLPHTGATNSDGAYPDAGLVLSGNTLYGTAPYGGGLGNGTVFAINTDGTGFTNLHSFTQLSPFDPPNRRTNSDGANPEAGLVLSGNTLYGTAQSGGSLGAGTVFAINTDGTDFTNLHSFSAPSTNPAGVQTNSDGYQPRANLVLSGNTLYGTAAGGGSSGAGTVFSLNTDGTGFTNLHSFAGYPSDGANPQAGLILSGNTLYGTASAGGSSSNGTVFGLLTDGTGFTTLHNFTAGSAYTNGSGAVVYINSDGVFPNGGLILLGNTLYGTAHHGGSSGYGTVFSLSLLSPQLSMTISGPYVILTWPANDPAVYSSGFRVQATLDPLPFTPATLWTDFVAPPLIINGRYTITVLDGIFKTQRLYRLRSF